MVWQNLTKTTTTKNPQYSWIKVTCFCLSWSYYNLLFFHFFPHLSCMFIVYLINLNMFWSYKMHSGMTWHHYRLVGLHLAVVLWITLCLCVCVNTVYNINILCCKTLCEVFWYQNMQTTHGLENSVVWCQPGPEGATLWRCDVNELLTVMVIYTNVTI